MFILGQNNEKSQCILLHISCKVKRIMNGFNDMCEKFGLHSNFQCGCDYKKNSN
jgi:hypothetical protein